MTKDDAQVMVTEQIVATDRYQCFNVFIRIAMLFSKENHFESPASLIKFSSSIFTQKLVQPQILAVDFCISISTTKCAYTDLNEKIH